MKKIVLFLLALFLLIGVNRGNPIVIDHPVFNISELYFDATGKWQLEISVHVPTQLNLDSNYVDSLILESLSGTARIKNFIINQYELIVVITQDSLFDSLTINNLQDYIYLNFYGRGLSSGCYFPVSWSSELRYGFSNSYIPKLLAGQSISNYKTGYYYYYYLDNSPTIGFPNDTVDATATLQGRIFDSNNNNITKGNFGIYPIIDTLHINANCDYYVRILANNSFHNTIAYLNESHSVFIDTFSINLQPHSLAYRDIHLLNFYNEIREVIKQNEQITVVNAPNPFNDKTTFYIKFPDYLKFTKASLKIYNLLGKEIIYKSLPINEEISISINFNSKPQGVYIYCLEVDSKVCKSGQIILSK